MMMAKKRLKQLHRKVQLNKKLKLLKIRQMILEKRKKRKMINLELIQLTNFKLKICMETILLQKRSILKLKVQVHQKNSNWLQRFQFKIAINLWRRREKVILSSINLKIKDRISKGINLKRLLLLNLKITKGAKAKSQIVRIQN